MGGVLEGRGLAVTEVPGPCRGFLGYDGGGGIVKLDIERVRALGYVGEVCLWDTGRDMHGLRNGIRSRRVGGGQGYRVVTECRVGMGGVLESRSLTVTE